MTNEEQEAFNLINKFGESASDVVDIVIQNIEATKLYLKECERILNINMEYWLKVKDFVLNRSSSADYKKELMLVTSYIDSANYLNGSFFSTYDKAVEIAKKFLEKYPPEKDDWGIEEEWDETVEAFVKSKL